MRARLTTLVAAAVIAAGCAAAPKPDYTRFFQNHPRSILVVPPMNNTTAVEAPDVFATTITVPIAERGYYIFPVYLVADLLRDIGLTNEGLIHQLPANRFREIFGADAVLFVTIKDWTTKYVLLASSVTVTASYKLVDTKTGQVIWEGERRAVYQSSGSNIIAILVSALVTTTVDYRPLAREANKKVTDSPGTGLPAGPYHAEFEKDYDRYSREREGALK